MACLPLQHWLTVVLLVYKIGVKNLDETVLADNVILTEVKLFLFLMSSDSKKSMPAITDICTIEQGFSFIAELT